MTDATQKKKGPKMLWLVFAVATCATWGLYGAFLAKGAAGFDHNRMKAFFFVGVAYVLVAIIAPAVVMLVNGDSFDFLTHPKGLKLSLFAGILGAVGAFTALMGLSSNPLPGPQAASQVMSVIFAGAPVVAAIYAVSQRADGFSGLPWQFFLGLVLAAAGGALVTLYKPA
ncbi:MAG TPA: hypothetical protein VEJ63_17350 [Planctomycetota bacterium]|nr:hypothetical protein [Planctomycetota bacterium]